MVKQRAVDAGASEVRRILQGGTMSRSAPAVSTIPPPDRVPGFVSAGGQPMQSPVQMPHSMPSQPGQILPQTGQQIPEMAQTVPLYVGVEAPPHFNLHQRLRGPGRILTSLASCNTVVFLRIGIVTFEKPPFATMTSVFSISLSSILKCSVFQTLV